MYITEDKFNALLEVVNTMKSKLELYEKFEHAREKEFRELERDVYKLKNADEFQLCLSEVRPNHGQPHSDSSAGVAWLR